MFFRGFWVWIKRHTFVIFSMSSSNNVYKTQHSGDVCRRQQADVGSQGKLAARKKFPAMYQLHARLSSSLSLVWVICLVCKTVDPKPNLKTVEREILCKLSYKNCLSLFMTLKNSVLVEKIFSGGSLTRLLKMIVLSLVLHNVLKQIKTTRLWPLTQFSPCSIVENTQPLHKHG